MSLAFAEGDMYEQRNTLKPTQTTPTYGVGDYIEVQHGHSGVVCENPHPDKEWAKEEHRVWFKPTGGSRALWTEVRNIKKHTPYTPPPTPAPASNGMKYDGGKPRMDLLLSGCPQALTQVAEILTFGAAKYAAHSWQTVPQGDERYLAALLRHLTAHAGGEDKDAESGMSHLAHAACNALFILELEARRAKSKPTV